MHIMVASAFMPACSCAVRFKLCVSWLPYPVSTHVGQALGMPPLLLFILKLAFSHDVLDPELRTAHGRVLIVPSHGTEVPPVVTPVIGTPINNESIFIKSDGRLVARLPESIPVALRPFNGQPPGQEVVVQVGFNGFIDHAEGERCHGSRVVVLDNPFHV
jgi:hypothetical protein